MFILKLFMKLKKKRGKFLSIFICIIGLFFVLINNCVCAQEEAASALSNSQIQTAMQAAQQVLQIISQIFGNLKTNLESNSQSENNRLSKINAPRLPEDPSGNVTPEVFDVETNSNRVGVNFTGMEVTLEDRNTGNKLIVYNRPGSIANINTNSSLENTITANTTNIVIKDGQELGVVRVGNETTFIDSSGANVSSKVNSNILANELLPLVSASENGFNNNFFSKQYVVFSDNDIFMNGENILFFPLKEFDAIIVNGSKLMIMEEDNDVIINNDKILYSRKIGKGNFIVKRIMNENNKNIIFGLVNGGSKGVYFIDDKKVLSVGNSIVKNPVDDYENVSIPAVRLDMWKKSWN